jgi:hypothetical protein
MNKCRGCGGELDPLQYSIGLCISCDVARGYCHGEVDDLKLELARVTLECAQYRQRLNIKRIMFQDARRDIVGLIALLDTFLGGSEEEYALSVKPTEAAMVEDIRMRWGVQDDGVMIGASLLCESSGPKPTAAPSLDSPVGEKS